ncbi:MAG: hypothetical protein H7Y15_09345, partial [Pseudonocardia sp.]|nr:hypothetical protein [Pseudonocardia sp.]
MPGPRVRPTRLSSAVAAHRPRFAALAVLAVVLGGLVGPIPAPGPVRAAPSAVTIQQPNGPGRVTISQTRDLVYQSIELSWSGFTPTGAGEGPGILASQPLVFAQCRGAQPDREDCLIRNRIGELIPGQPTITIYPFVDADGKVREPEEIGLGNEVAGYTNALGTGRATMEIRPLAELSDLGCTRAVDAAGAEVPACSLVIIPITEVVGGLGSGTGQDALFEEQWVNRMVVPLFFAPTPRVCDLSTPDITIQGAPTLQRAMESWQPALCTRADRLDVGYVQSGEPLARTTLANEGNAIAALTVRPFDPPDGPAVAHAPLSVSAVGLGFVIDDQVTKEQIRDLTITPRLIAKLITESYGPTPDNVGNPGSFTEDPEFRALNPTIDFNRLGQLNPVLVSGRTDQVFELTRWVAADPAARAFLAGQPDEFGTQVNRRYAAPTPYTLPVDRLEFRGEDIRR